MMQLRTLLIRVVGKGRRWARARGWMRRLEVATRSVWLFEDLPAFAPNVIGTPAARDEATLAAANRTFPLLARLTALGERKPAPFVDALEFASDPAHRTAAETLKALLDEYGSDKANLHNYHYVYGRVFAAAGDVGSVLEIGLGTNDPDVLSTMGPAGQPGASLRAFRDYLPNATFFGADVDRQVLFGEERISTFFVDQTDPDSLETLGRRLPQELDVIIDDGLHAPHANIAVLTFAIPKVKRGGWIVIEDIATAALPIWEVVSILMPSNFECYIIGGAEADERLVEGMVFAAHRTS